MDINKTKQAIVSLFVITVCFWFLPLSTHAASRGISVLSDLSHQSGKLGSYRALLIGINEYNDPKIPYLETAVNDVTAMAKLLKERYGFQVKLLLNRKATREGIYRALRKLALSAKSDDSVLIYYAGHGDLDRTYDDGWWIPVDAIAGNPVTYLDNVQVQKAMRSMKARHVLLISDSCYSGTLFGQARSMPPVINDKYYLNLYNEKSRWGMTSGNKTPVSDRGTGGHSVFAYQLLKELRNNEKPYISTQELYTRIAPIVSNNSEQTPICRPIRNTGDQGGEFIFVASFGSAASAYKSISVKPKSAQLPHEVGVSFDDILKAEEVQRQTKEKWKVWQQARGNEYKSIKQIDESNYLTPEQKIVAWKRFSSAVSQDNPYSQKDDKMRSFSKSRILHWEKLRSATVSHAYNFTGLERQSTAHNGTYIAYATGVVYDKNTGLEWYVGPDRDTTWSEAKSWVERLSVAGDGWRMPTEDELYTLYQKGTGTRNMTPLLKTTGWWVWSDETKDLSSAWGFNFLNGNVLWIGRDQSNYNRGFAVRSRR